MDVLLVFAYVRPDMLALAHSRVVIYRNIVP